MNWDYWHSKNELSENITERVKQEILNRAERAKANGEKNAVFDSGELSSPEDVYDQLLVENFDRLIHDFWATIMSLQDHMTETAYERAGMFEKLLSVARSSKEERTLSLRMEIEKFESFSFHLKHQAYLVNAFPNRTDEPDIILKTPEQLIEIDQASRDYRFELGKLFLGEGNGIDSDEIYAYRWSPPHNVQDALAVLGFVGHLDFDKIKKRYQRLVNYHGEDSGYCPFSKEMLDTIKKSYDFLSDHYKSGKIYYLPTQ